MKYEIIIKVNGKYYKQVNDTPENGCNVCALNEICGSISWVEPICGGKHFEEFEIEPTKEMIKKVLRLSDEAEENFKEGCRFIIGNTIDERIDNIKRQQAGLSSDERIKFIKDHWNEEIKK